MALLRNTDTLKRLQQYIWDKMSAQCCLKYHLKNNKIHYEHCSCSFKNNVPLCSKL